MPSGANLANSARSAPLPPHDFQVVGELRGREEVAGAAGGGMIEMPARPLPGEFDQDAAGTLHDHGGDFDHQHPPGARLASA